MKPIIIDLKDYELSGGGKLGEINRQLNQIALLRTLCVEKMMGYQVTYIRPAVHQMIGIK